MRHLITLLIVGWFVFLTACNNPLAATPTPTPTCVQLAQPTMQELESIAREWDDANKLAGQTPRASLAPQIDKLQATRRKVQDMQVPSCVDAAHRAFIESMDATIDGYIAFLGRKPDADVSNAFKRADDAMTAFSEELRKMSTPAPTRVP